MASTMITRKPCSMCPKGIGILTCDGCYQSFCAKHISDHRQALSVEIETIGQEYDLLQQDLIRDESPSHPIFSRIDVWEQTSIRKIEQNAQQLRDNLRSQLHRNHDGLKDRCKTVTSELQASRNSGDYTEIDLRSWTDKLKELRTLLDQQATIDLIDDAKPLVQSTSLKILHATAAASSSQGHASSFNVPSFGATANNSTLLFQPFVGNAVFSVNHLVARHNGDPKQSTMICLNQLFHSTTSQIRFRIEQKTNRFLFFGILHGEQEMNRAAFHSPSLYGWMSFDDSVVQSRKEASTIGQGLFDENDELIMTLNGKTGVITLARPTTKTVVQLKISLQQCPLPWRVVVAFFNRNDSVRLMGKEWNGEDYCGIFNSRGSCVIVSYTILLYFTVETVSRCLLVLNKFDEKFSYPRIKTALAVNDLLYSSRLLIRYEREKSFLYLISRLTENKILTVCFSRVHHPVFLIKLAGWIRRVREAYLTCFINLWSFQRDFPIQSHWKNFQTRQPLVP